MFDTTVRARLLMAGLYHLGSHDENVLTAVRDLKATDFVTDFINSGKHDESMIEAVLIAWAGSGDIQADLGELVRIARHRDGSTASIVASSAAMEVLNLAIEIDGPAFRPMLRSLGYDPDAVKFGNHPPAAVDRYALASTVGSAGDLSQHSETEPRVAESGQVTSLKPPGWVGRGLYPAPSGVSGAMNDANRLVEMPPIVPANLTRADVLEFLHSRGWVSAYPEVHYLDAQELRQPVTNEIHQWAAALEIEFDNDLVDHNDPPFDSAVAPTTVAPAVSGNRGARRKKNPSAARKARAKRKG